MVPCPNDYPRQSCVVIGVFNNELWYKCDNVPFIQPFDFVDRWTMDCRYAPEITGLQLAQPWCDMFCSDMACMTPSFYDQFVVDPPIQVYSTTDGDTLGINVTDRAIRSVWSPFHRDMTVIRQDTIVTSNVGGVLKHSPSGPQAVVIGVYRGDLYLQYRDRADSRVEPVERRQLPKWIECDDWRASLHPPFVQRLPQSTCYAHRVGLEPPSSLSAGVLWGMETEVDRFEEFDVRVVLALERLFNGKVGSKHYDSDGGVRHREDELHLQEQPVSTSS